jgi:hypothetical protein
MPKFGGILDRIQGLIYRKIPAIIKGEFLIRENPFEGLLF